jgi:hypothetical protein
MRLSTMLGGIALASAIAVTSLLTSMVAQPANAAVGNGSYWVNFPYPSSYYQFTNPLIPQYPQQPIFGP